MSAKPGLQPIRMFPLGTFYHKYWSEGAFKTVIFGCAGF